ncbi:MAG: anthranilate synthase component [Rickettsiaceae bacterium]|jgi:anthranilate synthase/aminodeoxychorismate synthase-like glutamine amidotransferase|nr:anthranilate synthase component [Rickettsiaceae bacterium]
MILLIDNYDSFTYNLYHYIIQAGSKDVLVKRNDQISISEIKTLNPQAIVLSPGPCTPSDAGICLEVIEKLKDQYPILGVCLGHQAIGQAFGGNVVKTYPMHGKVSEIYHQNAGVFKGLPSPFKATRYHSLIIEKETCPKDLEITATTKDGIIMGVRHKKYNIEGVQFHPESIASEHGHQMIVNFIGSINIGKKSS